MSYISVLFYKYYLSHDLLTLGTGRLLTHHIPWIQVSLYNIMIVYVIKILKHINLILAA